MTGPDLSPVPTAQGTECGRRDVRHNCQVAHRRPSHRPLAIDGSHWRADGQAKVRFATEGEALRAADDRARESGVDLGVYRCDFCGGWHMGKRSGRQADE